MFPHRAGIAQGSVHTAIGAACRCADAVGSCSISPNPLLSISEEMVCPSGYVAVYPFGFIFLKFGVIDRVESAAKVDK